MAEITHHALVEMWRNSSYPDNRYVGVTLGAGETALLLLGHYDGASPDEVRSDGWENMLDASDPLASVMTPGGLVWRPFRFTGSGEPGEVHIWQPPGRGASYAAVICLRLEEGEEITGWATGSRSGFPGEGDRVSLPGEAPTSGQLVTLVTFQEFSPI